MNFSYLTTFQLTTFILGIVFSILTIAVVFYALRHPIGFKSTFVKVLFTIIIPTIMFIMWFACAFASYGILKANELHIILLSIACGIALMGLTAGTAILINFLVKKKNAAKVEKEIEKENTEIYIVTSAEENSDEEKKD